MSAPAKQPAPGSADPQPSAPSSSTLPDPSLAAPALPPTEVGFTAQDLIDRQSQLEREAHEAFPYRVSRCTYENGPSRQLVFACRTCSPEGKVGVCAACSVSCHAEHELVELFYRRNFQCDCGTIKSNATEETTQACTLREPPHAIDNEANVYDHTFRGEFCYCERGKVYNPHEEKETMFQCLVCEDWLHETCTTLKKPGADAQGMTESATAADDIPSLLDHDLFEHIICDACVRMHKDVLWPYAGTRGWIFAAPKQTMEQAISKPGSDAIEGVWDQEPVRTLTDGTDSWLVFGLPAGSLSSDAVVPNKAEGASDPTVPASQKRALSPEAGAGNDDEGQARKKAKTDGEPSISEEAAESPKCRKPQRNLPDLTHDQPANVRVDLFMMPSFRERICRCENCLPAWAALPFVLEEEETLSPPPTSTPSESGSTYSLGMAALNHLPREKMLTALNHYQDFRAKLFEMLQPFAESGQTVDEETIRAFSARIMNRNAEQ
ncbi:hypothetical protein OC846_004450 [Tilletia horrida]|uniref:UBR-type domain-containing protein n=1 Tax=Tilletia horrida TaxID=155126 RepID=A0AAN6GPM8_9BASI|nr:hypothetical protein OC846_004450 [Tilletia horrida]KAK0565377.1 hypothetical protein OC861_003789 [Tilletia horrida]